MRKKFDIIEKSLQQEMKRALEAHFRLFPQKFFQNLKVFCRSKILRFQSILKIKPHQFWKISSLKLPSLKFLFGREEIIFLLVFFGLIGLVVLGTLFNRSGTQFLMTFC